MKSIVNFYLIGLIAFLVGCSSVSERELSGFSEQEFYEMAQDQLKNNRFILAIETLQRLESDYPFGKYANSAQLALIYAHYRADEFPSAIATANRYIRLHPNHPNVDYAYYMRGLSAFPRLSSAFQKIFHTDLSERDMKSARTSFVYFSELLQRFADSQYADDAIKRMEYLRNLMARGEVQVGNYYLDRGAFLAAANRGRHVVENYQLSPAVPDGLALMAQAYHAMDMNDLAKNTINILKENYPNYPAFNSDGQFNFDFYLQKSRSIAGMLTFGLIDNSKPPGFDTRHIYSDY
ncbi:MAG: outer membrane protein assembly factor BamD [Cellvibrionaceae bacterium]|jgi:outer membrane protein assembly factor BamD